jgi:hypothetical protein
MSMRFQPADRDGEISYSFREDGSVSIACRAVYPPWAVLRHSEVVFEVPRELVGVVRQALGVPVQPELGPVDSGNEVKNAVIRDYFADKNTTAVREGVTQRSVAKAHGINPQRVSEWVRAEADMRNRLASLGGEYQRAVREGTSIGA